eukprot:CAMPEP_0113559372 /NCGR_PEP_ID=MMETSP0015_2-20120614/18863_1 /TAXON_ID=2838 /ORGANISM="Odontella" /LENGTH=97 /DNA_ID=CAMNT_0000461007 /DNA_START=653 /DNA_END=942 /DNA_ORIENTATION=+ /assembly_acc=CAM_ASM_000160
MSHVGADLPETTIEVQKVRDRRRLQNLYGSNLKRVACSDLRRKRRLAEAAGETMPAIVRPLTAGGKLNRGKSSKMVIEPEDPLERLARPKTSVGKFR